MSENNKIDIELLEQIYDCSTTCILDENFAIIESNENFNKLSGYSESEVSGISLLQLKHQDQSNSVYDFLIRTLEKGEIWKGELQFSHKTKHLIWLDTTIKPILLNHQKKRYIGTFIDISPRKVLIDNLKQRAHRQGLIAILGQISLNNIPIQDLLEQTLSVVCGSLNINIGVIQEIAVDGEKALVRASYNTAILQPGETVLNIINNNILEYTLHSDRPVICESLENEKRFNTPDEYLQENASSAICILIGDKKYPFGIFTLLSDKPKDLNIDEIHFLQSVCNILAEAINRKNMEQALRHEQELSRNYLDVAEVVFIVLDTKGNILLANRYAASILGYSQESLAGMNFINAFIPEEYQKTVFTNFKKMINKEKTQNNLVDIHGNVTPVINRQNNLRHIRWRSSALLSDNGDVNAILSSGEDITDILAHEKEQKHLEKQLHQAQKVEAIGMLAGGIAHDFNNILASILGFSELAFETLNSDDTKLHKYLTQIQNSGIKARDIIAQLQSINLQDDSAEKAILLPSLLKGTLQMLRSALPSSIDMQLNINNDVPAVKINAPRFNQMIMHILTNSRNALNGKGSIEINLKTEELSETCCTACNSSFNGRYVVLSIHDNGPGINSNIFPEIFSNKTKNTNAGLPFISHVIHNTHGHLLISESHLSTNTNAPGTCIKLLFEIVDESSIEEKQKKDEIDFSAIYNKHIMIVDDENSVASYMGELFRGAGFNATVFCDSAEALESFKNNPDSYDLIVSDQTMPVITGDILASQMLELKPELPVIICTGHSDLLDKEKAEDLQIKALLAKPVDSAELLHTVVNLLTEKK
ncbi:MAG: hypothetical protein DIZ80_04265 [endosymbiont of Galathealinum brachiosum]|uniref:histidine kinase n=1 Tax=endosymbiont of Galathealinum brachiosum TaxID=2200906 RepID=A0A370DID8_9GAMM|nr:MAG: hypothetical protein DIZ80_04265 [endosymbiont of Galathealinum brachiosum]